MYLKLNCFIDLKEMLNLCFLTKAVEITKYFKSSQIRLAEKQEWLMLL